MPNVYRKYDTKTGVWADFGDLKARQDIGIVEDTDTATHAINDGQYVIWKGNLYTANSAIAIDTVLSTSNLTAVNNGGLNNLKNDLNTNITNINSSLSAIDSSLAIVADGDIHVAITSGQYVYVKNHSTLTEGLYTANSAIGADVALTVSNLTSVSGGFNSLNSKLNTLQAAVTAPKSWFQIGNVSSNAPLNSYTFPSSGTYLVIGGHNSGRPLNAIWIIRAGAGANDGVSLVACSDGNNLTRNTSDITITSLGSNKIKATSVEAGTAQLIAIKIL